MNVLLLLTLFYATAAMSYKPELIGKTLLPGAPEDCSLHYASGDLLCSATLIEWNEKRRTALLATAWHCLRGSNLNDLTLSCSNTSGVKLTGMLTALRNFPEEFLSSPIISDSSFDQVIYVQASVSRGAQKLTLAVPQPLTSLEGQTQQCTLSGASNAVNLNETELNPFTVSDKLHPMLAKRVELQFSNIQKLPPYLGIKTSVYDLGQNEFAAADDGLYPYIAAVKGDSGGGLICSSLETKAPAFLGVIAGTSLTDTNTIVIHPAVRDCSQVFGANVQGQPTAYLFYVKDKAVYLFTEGGASKVLLSKAMKTAVSSLGAEESESYYKMLSVLPINSNWDIELLGNFSSDPTLCTCTIGPTLELSCLNKE